MLAIRFKPFPYFRHMVLFFCIRHQSYCADEASRACHKCRSSGGCEFVSFPSLGAMANFSSTSDVNLQPAAVTQFGNFMLAMASFTKAKIDKQLPHWSLRSDPDLENWFLHSKHCLWSSSLDTTSLCIKRFIRSESLSKPSEILRAFARSLWHNHPHVFEKHWSCVDFRTGSIDVKKYVEEWGRSVSSEASTSNVEDSQDATWDDALQAGGSVSGPNPKRSRNYLRSAARINAGIWPELLDSLKALPPSTAARRATAGRATFRPLMGSLLQQELRLYRDAGHEDVPLAYLFLSCFDKMLKKQSLQRGRDYQKHPSHRCSEKYFPLVTHNSLHVQVFSSFRFAVRIRRS